MEDPDQDMVVLQSFRQMLSMKLSAGASPEQQQELQDLSEPEPESNQKLAGSKSGSALQTLIEFRMKQLQNRRFILEKMQHLKKTAEDNGVGIAEEISLEERDETCELEAIQKELDELVHKKEDLEKGQEDACSTSYKPEIPRGGIYMLPPPQLTQEDVTPAAETPTGPVIPVDSLGETSAVTRCPSCDEVILTETHRKVGEAMWLFCCLCSMAGCIAGCCLIPFFMDRLRSVHHQCPQCQAHIHTSQPI